MNDFNKRQLSLFLIFIKEYRNGLIILNSLVDRLESLLNFIDVQPLRDELDNLVGDVELINAICIDRKQGLSEAFKEELANLLQTMEDKIQSSVA